MKWSEVNIKDVAEYLREDEETELLTPILAAARSYILGYTGLTAEEAEKYEDLSLALLAVCADMYDKRGATSTVSLSENRLVSNILGMYSVNLLEGEANG
ncbi:MAG: phage gp6-like head-tail connector protein [Firmicutes bacterium]|nr:phage gp6-like head-tail connector protein [Bacillota bacterium]